MCKGVSYSIDEFRVFLEQFIWPHYHVDLLHLLPCDSSIQSQTNLSDSYSLRHKLYAYTDNCRNTNTIHANQWINIISEILSSVLVYLSYKHIMFFYGSQFVLLRKGVFNGIVQPKMSIQSLVTHLGVILMLCDLLSFLFSEHSDQTYCDRVEPT